MLKSILILIFLSFCIGTGVWLFFMSAVKRGDFDDIEGAKYRMLEDDDEDLCQKEKRTTERSRNDG